MQDIPFVVNQKQTIVFGSGVLDQLPQHAAKYGKRVLLCTGKSATQRGLLDRLMKLLEGFEVVHFDRISPNPKAEEVAQALALMKTMDKPIDVVAAVGGGSIMDFAKAVAASYASQKPVTQLFGVDTVDRALPVIAVPTTHGTGSEVTKYAIITHQGKKLAISDAKILPAVALIDPLLTYSMPAEVAVDTSLDALSHLTEAYFSALCNPVTEAFAEKGLTYMAPYLKTLHNLDEEGHYHLTLASMMGGIAINLSGSGLVHAMGYPFTSEFGVPHGRANALIMPALFRFNAEAVPHKYAKLSELLNTPDLSTLLQELNHLYGYDAELKNIAVDEPTLQRWAEGVVANQRLMRSAPRKPTTEEVVALYKQVLGLA